MNARPLLFASALFCSPISLADEPDAIVPPVDVCTVTTNTKGGPLMEVEVPCEAETATADVETTEPPQPEADPAETEVEEATEAEDTESATHASVAR